MKLTQRQQVVLANSLAWCDLGKDGELVVFSEKDIEIFFGHIDRGQRLSSDGSVQLFRGWTAHYSDPYVWIRDWESGKSTNPPIIPPAAWVYDAYFSDGKSWIGWANLLMDFIRDAAKSKNPIEAWRRVRPAFEVAYKMAAYSHERLTVKELQGR